MKTKIRFDDSVPSDLHPRLTRIFDPFLGVLAREIRVLRISMKGAKEAEVEGDAATLAMRRYHWAEILIDPSFFTLEVEEQERTAAHEIVHILHNLYAREIQHLLVHLVSDEIQEYLEWRLEDAEERVVDALGDAFWEIVNDARQHQPLTLS